MSLASPNPLIHQYRLPHLSHLPLAFPEFPRPTSVLISAHLSLLCLQIIESSESQCALGNQYCSNRDISPVIFLINNTDPHSLTTDCVQSITYLIKCSAVVVQPRWQ